MKTEGRSSTLTRRTMLSLAYHRANVLELSFVVFHAWESDFVVSWSLGCNIKPYVTLDVCLNTLNLGHVGFLIVLCSVMVSRLVLSVAATKPRASCGTWHKVCCSARAGIEIASHDPSGTTPMGYLLMINSLVVFPIFVGRSYIELGHLCYVRMKPRWFGCNLLDMFVLLVCEPLINSVLVVGKHRYCSVNRMNASIDALDKVV
jgi:hypothetical protein